MEKGKVMKMIYLYLVLNILSVSSLYAADSSNYFRVWQGFKKDSINYEQFNEGLPRLMQETIDLYNIDYLNNYMVIIPPANKPDFIPDELALVGLSSKADYDFVKSTERGQAYMNMHGDYFQRGASKSARGVVNYKTEQPLELKNELAYDMIGKPIDWSVGYNRIIIGVKKPTLSQSEYKIELKKHIELAQKKMEPLGLKGYIVIANDQYEVAFLSWESKSAFERALENQNGIDVFVDAERIMDILMNQEAPQLKGVDGASENSTYNFSPPKNKIKLTTFNIIWYGLGGSMKADLSDEFRDSWLKEFIQSEYADQDVILFQEIVDKDRFINQVMAGFMKCKSYDHDYELHQHVVICYKPKYNFETLKLQGEFTFPLENTISGKSRPAVHGVLKDSKNNKLLYLLGVHLKAFPQETDIRLSQSQSIANQLKNNSEGLPVVVFGDFNTHIKKLTERQNDDWVEINQLFKDNLVELKHVNNKNEFTFRESHRGFHLDHFWISNNTFARSGAKVWKACNLRDREARRFNVLSFYNRFISDHCPVSIDLEF